MKEHLAFMDIHMPLYDSWKYECWASNDTSTVLLYDRHSTPSQTALHIGIDIGYFT
jgi:hypothetical protein